MTAPSLFWVRPEVASRPLRLQMGSFEASASERRMPDDGWLAVIQRLRQPCCHASTATRLAKKSAAQQASAAAAGSKANGGNMQRRPRQGRPGLERGSAEDAAWYGPAARLQLARHELIGALMRLPKILALLSLGIGGFGCWSTAVSAQIEAANLRPLNEWDVEVLEDRCVFRRSFGEPDSPTTLELGSIDPWDGGFQTAILTGRYSATEEAFRAGWLPGGRIANIERITVLEGEDGARGILFPHGLWDGAMESRVVDQNGPFNVLAVDPDYELDEGPRRFREGIETFLVVGAFDMPLLFATGPMQAIFEQREACMDEVLISQGVDPAENERDDSRVEMANGRWLTERVIRRAPREIRRQDRPTAITFLLYLDAEAQPSSCRLASLPYDEEYERGGCELLMESAEFEFKKGEAAQPTFYKVFGFYGP